ncbi:MAG TPA: hypothetical protein VGH16_16355 [Candidatus Binatia bacterium]
MKISRKNMASRKLFNALLLFAICAELCRGAPALAAEKIPETSQAPVRFAGADGRPAYPADPDTNTLSVRCKTADGSTFESCAGAGGGGGAGTEYTEDAAPPANPIGRAISCRRRDALAGETDADGDWVTGNCTNKGELYVKHPDPIPASQSGAWNINNISGSIALPTGAATAANQSTGNASLTSIDGKITAVNTGAVTISSALPAGNNNIGDVDVASVPADPFGANADAAVAAGAAGSVQAKLRRISADVDAIKTAVETIDNIVSGSGANITQWGGTNVVNGGVGGSPGVGGDTAHDAVDAGNPVKIGAKAVSHGSNPTAVAAGDRTNIYANRHGIPFVIAGHPNIQTLEAEFTGNATDQALITVGGGTKIVVTKISWIASADHFSKASFRVGFGAANTPTTTGVVITGGGVYDGKHEVEGNGAGIIGIGGDGEDLRITIGSLSSGSVRFLVTYYTIES